MDEQIEDLLFGLKRIFRIVEGIPPNCMSVSPIVWKSMGCELKDRNNKVFWTGVEVYLDPDSNGVLIQFYNGNRRTI